MDSKSIIKEIENYIGEGSFQEADKAIQNYIKVIGYDDDIYNIPDESCYKFTMKIKSFSLLIKREVIDKLGELNEYFISRHAFDEEVSKLNSVIFKVLFPILMFSNIYGNEISEVFDLELVIFSVSAVLILYLIITYIVLKIEKGNKKTNFSSSNSYGINCIRGFL